MGGGHFCWSECCDEGPHACICGNDCEPTVTPPTIPDTLCGVNGCTYTPHHGPHTWEEDNDG